MKKASRNLPGNSSQIALFVAAVLVLIITWLVYLPSLNNGFISWDDDEYVYRNQMIRHFDPALIKNVFTTFSVYNWHPLTWISYALDYALWGLNPLGYHLTNVIVHGLNAFLIVLLIGRLFRSAQESGAACSQSTLKLTLAAFLSGILFGIHPLHVESVAWIAERKDVLCAFFYLLSLSMYVEYALKKRFRALYWLSFLFFVFSLLSKAMAVTLPVILLLLDIYPLKRLAIGKRYENVKNIVLEKVPFFIMSGLVTILTILSHKALVVKENLLPLADRFLISVRTTVFYLKNFAYPLDLSPFYPLKVPVVFTAADLLYIMIFVAITGLGVIYWKKNRLFLTVWLYFLITLLPTLGIVQTGAQAAADRYTYLPLIGPMFLIGLGISEGLEKIRKIRRGNGLLSIAYSVPIFLLFAGTIYVTQNQIKIWHDSVSLWNRAIERSPFESSIPYAMRGLAYRENGEYLNAVDDFTLALNLDATNYEVYRYRGITYVMLGDYRDALGDFDKLISKGMASPEILYYRAEIHRILNDGK